MSSISNAYKLQIEKLTNKINRLILENRKLNNFICEGDDTTGGSVLAVLVLAVLVLADLVLVDQVDLHLGHQHQFQE